MKNVGIINTSTTVEDDVVMAVSALLLVALLPSWLSHPPPLPLTLSLTWGT